MFNYTACPRPLCGVLVAQSLTIAVALLIELAMVEKGLAQAPCPPKACNIPFVRPIEQICESKGYYYLPIAERDEKGHRINPPERLDWLVGFYNRNFTPHTSKNAVLMLPINTCFKETRTMGTTVVACPGDIVCFPNLKNFRSFRVRRHPYRAH
jgi:hypothetical protein